ncbi:MAG: type III-A CRISPR-associated protein Csm2 [Bacteroidota bacterium]
MNGNRNRNRPQGRGGGGDRGSRQIDPDAIVQAVQQHFGGYYRELLNMEQSDDLNGLDKKLKDFVEANYRDVTSSQLRNIFGKIKPIDKQDKNKLKMQRPKLAYIIARQNKKKGALNLMYWFDDLIKKVNTPEDVDGFKKLLESVVAYHKYFETINPTKR